MNYLDVIRNVVRDLKGKNAEEKICSIRSQLTVLMGEDEVGYSEEKIVEIIVARFKEECPSCKGFGFYVFRRNKCPDCNGQGYISPVEAEKIIHRNLEQWK